jgi:hypothetical protein
VAPVSRPAGRSGTGRSARSRGEGAGREALRQLRAIDPEVRVLFAGGYTAEHLPAAEQGQALGCVKKP